LQPFLRPYFHCNGYPYFYIKPAAKAGKVPLSPIHSISHIQTGTIMKKSIIYHEDSLAKVSKKDIKKMLKTFKGDKIKKSKSTKFFSKIRV